MRVVFYLFLSLLLIQQVAAAEAKIPQRIISTMPAITEMLYALNLGDRVVGVTTNCNYPAAARNKEKIGGYFLNLEKITNLKPDLVIMQEDAQKGDISKLKERGFNVMTVNPRNIEGVFTEMIRLGEKLGVKEKAERVVTGLRKKVDRRKQKEFDLDVVLNRPRVLVIVGNKPLIVAGGGTFIDDILTYAGAENIAANMRAAFPQYSMEQMLEANPDYLIIPQGVLSRAELNQDSRWHKLSVVKQDKILFIDPDIISRPGPRVVEAVTRVATFIGR